MAQSPLQRPTLALVGRSPSLPPRRPRVAVAMSGGVDSSVAAALLQEQGYEVVGITMQIWPDSKTYGGLDREGSCCSLSAAEDARRVADRLGFPHFVLNFREVFQEKVIQDFVEEYLRGRTPNPCIRCNEFIKFAALLHKARALEVDYVATGHYARVGFDPGRGRYTLRRGVDPRKDQSYTLYPVPQELLARILMPLGEWRKEEVREKARQLGLRVANKPESQEICFVPEGDYRRFLREHAGERLRPGPILNLRGEVLGQHPGLAFFTVGQRRGLGLSWHEPLYVLALDPERNAVIVGPEEELYRRRFLVVQVNYVSLPPQEEPFEAEVMVRYRMSPQPATVIPLGEDTVEVVFHQPQRAITPGQSAVFYRGDEVLGGGRIERVDL